MPSRRTLLAAAGAAGAALSAGCITGDSIDAEPGDAESYDWPTGGADRRNSSSVPDGVAPRSNPAVDWRLEFDGALAAPVVTDDLVVLTTGPSVVAVDRETRKRRWSIAPDNDAVSYSGAATVGNGTAYVAGDRTLVAVDAETGEREWEYDVEYPFVDHSPTYVGRTDRVYAAAGEYVRAFDAESGEVVWERQLLGTVEGSIAYDDGPGINHFVPTQGGELYALDDDGRVRWRRQLSAGIATAPTVVTSADRRLGTGIVVGCRDGRVYCFDTAGRREWRADAGPFAEGGLAVAHDGVFVRSTSTLYAFDANDGDERWRVDLGDRTRNPPIVVGDTVYVGGDRLHALKIGGGTGIRRFRFGETRFERSFDGPVHYVSAADGRLFAVVDRDSSGVELVRLS